MMSFLARSEIEKRQCLRQPQLIVKNYKPEQLQQCSYDLALGEEVYLVGKDAPERLSTAYPYVSIPPGQFAVLTCFEHIKMPDDLMGFIALRSKFKLQGLVNISGFHVDPTHEGTLLFAVQNVGPSEIRLRYKDPTFTIFFSRVDGQIVEGRSKEDTHFKPYLKGIRLNDVQLLGGSSVTITKLQKEIEQLRFIIFVYTPLAAGLLAAIVKLIWK